MRLPLGRKNSYNLASAYFKEQVEGADEDEEKVKKAMLEMIHSLFVITETFFLHPSLSAEGEYHLVLNGITLFKVNFRYNF